VAIFLKECTDEQVTPIQWGILTLVGSNPGVGHIEIAEELGLDRSNVANVVDRLTRRRLLKQTTHKDDRRKKSILITPAGRKLMKAFEPKARRAQRRFLGLLNDNERRNFMTVLTRLVEHNNEHSRAPIRNGR
jgi:DNA-binding MarR family transcriptional regulator